MSITCDQLICVAIESIEIALGVTEEGLLSICESCDLDLGFGDSADVEVDFDDTDFMSRYYGGRRLSMTFSVLDNKATVNVTVGDDCSNPAMANEFIRRYMNGSEYRDVWHTPRMADRGSGLLLRSQFAFKDEMELTTELAKRLVLFKHDCFTNQLRPFIHYFDN